MQEEARAWTKARLFERQNGEIQYGQSGVGGQRRDLRPTPKGRDLEGQARGEACCPWSLSSTPIPRPRDHSA